MKMKPQFLYLSLVIITISLNSTIAGAATGNENDLSRLGRSEPPGPAAIQAQGAQLSSPSANPLWAVPLSALTATRERPVFTATRRPLTPPPAPTPLIESPVPPPPAPEEPLLTLLGTATGQTNNVAVVMDQTTKQPLRLHVGEAVSGWLLRSVDSRTMTLEKNSRFVTLALPAASNSEPPSSADVSKEADARDAS